MLRLSRSRHPLSTGTRPLRANLSTVWINLVTDLRYGGCLIGPFSRWHVPTSASAKSNHGSSTHWLIDLPVVELAVGKVPTLRPLCLSPPQPQLLGVQRLLR